MKEYIDFLSDKPMVVEKRKYYSDSEGFLNERAFWEFANDLTEDDKMYLLCLNIDVTASNEKHGKGFGTLTLRRVFIRFQIEYPIFRMGGTKFNVFVPADNMELIHTAFDTDNSELFTLQGEVIDDQYATKDNIKDLIAIGVKRLFGESADETIVGDKGNTEPNQQETKTEKYRATMWYGEILFKETKPKCRELKAYIFPTAYEPANASLNMVVAIDDYVTTPRVFCGRNIDIPIDGMRINVSSRFDNDGHLIVSYYQKDTGNDSGEITGELTVHEGNCIPESFGKRVGKTKAIFPIKMNGQGLYEYILYDEKPQDPKKQVSYVESGTIQGRRGNIYEVHMDSVMINLVCAQDTQEADARDMDER